MVLDRIAQKKPDLAPKVFDTFNIALKNRQNDMSSLENAYMVLKRIHLKPECTPYALSLLNGFWQNEKLDNGLLMDTYSIWSEMTWGHPHSVSDVFKKDPKLSLDILKVSKSRLKNDNQNPESLRCLNSCAFLVFLNHPDYWSEYLDIFKGVLQHKNSNNMVRDGAEICLNTLASRSDTLNPKFFDAAIKCYIQHEKLSDIGRSNGYYILGNLAKDRPDLIPDVLKLLKLGLQQENNGEHSLESACIALGKIIEIQSSLQPEVFDVFKDVLQNKHHNDDSLGKAYVGLSSIVQSVPDFASKILEKPRPDLASKVLELVEVGLQNDKNFNMSLESSYMHLNGIIEAQPNLAPKAFEVIKVGLQNEYNTSFSLEEARNTLKEIVKRQPNLASEVMKTFTKSKNCKSNVIMNKYYQEGKE